MQINYSAPLGTLGYGYTGYYILKNLIKLGVDVNVSPIGNPQLDMINEFASSWYGNKPIFNNAPSIRIWHQNEVHYRVGNGKHYGFPIFELDKFKPAELNSMNACDELIVTSEWGKEILKRNGVKPTAKVVPLGVDTDIFTPSKPSKRENTIFLNVGKWEIRKGHDILIECFNKAFNKNDKVELWLLCDNIFLQDGGKSWVDKCKNSNLAGKIRIIPRQNTHQNIKDIMDQADVGVFPARAEGWNLELLEMMSIGKNVITTNYSAHTEFCNNSNSKLIECDQLETANDNIWFHNFGSWVYLGDEQQEQLICHMRNLHIDKQNNNLNINYSGIDTGQKFSWKNSAKKLIEAIWTSRTEKAY